MVDFFYHDQISLIHGWFLVCDRINHVALDMKMRPMNLKGNIENEVDT